VEPFVIQCTTCRARLKVSDPALVGDIVGCPKCESFVQVTPPPGWQPPAPSVAAAVAAAIPNAGVPAGSSASGTIPVELTQSSAAAAAKPPKARGAAAKAPSAPPPPLPGSATPAAALSAAAIAGKTAPAARVASGTSSLIVPEPAAEPGALAQLLSAARQHYWISTGSLASLTALVAIAWMVFGWKANVSPATDSQSTDSQSTGLALGGNSQQNAADPNDKKPSAEKQDTNAATGDPQHATPDRSIAGWEEPAGTGEHADASTEPTDTSAEPAADATATADTALPGARRKTDSLDPIARALATEPEPLLSSNPGAAPTDLPDGLSPGKAAASKGVAPSSSAGSQEEAAESESATRAALVEHLQDRVPAGEFRGIPLIQFVAFLSDFSTVPITIDAESLQQAGKDSKTKITVKLAGETVEAALRAALAKPGLTFRIEPKRLVIVAGTAKP
jgi:hypothetical protein